MFKNNFIEFCNKKGQSPSSVCRAIGVSPAAFSKWTETSVPRRATLMRIADYLECTIDDLLADSPTPAPAPAPATPTNEELARQIAELRAALPPSSDPALSATRREAVEMIKKIDESQLDNILNYIRFLESQNK